MSEQELSSFTSTLQPCSSEPTIQEVFEYFTMYQKSVNQNVGCEITSNPKEPLSITDFSKTTKLATQIFQTSQQNINCDRKQQDDLIEEMGLATSVKNILKQDDAPSGDVHFPSMQQRTSLIFRKMSKIDPEQQQTLVQQMRDGVTIKELSKQKDAPSKTILFRLKKEEGLTRNYKTRFRMNQRQKDALVQQMSDGMTVKELSKQKDAPSTTTLSRLKKKAGLPKSKQGSKIDPKQQQALVQQMLEGVTIKELLKQKDAPSTRTLSRLKKKEGLTHNYKPRFKIDPEQQQALVQQMSDGMTVKELSKQKDAPSKATLSRLKKKAGLTHNYKPRFNKSVI